ncbi:MAG TPA: hypothetical protein VFE07_03890 [Marmoricola sp.]|nr:hypothetical protein [Marmoricola sp.]
MERVWTNSLWGRLLGTAFGVGLTLYLVFARPDPASGGLSWSGWDLVVLMSMIVLLLAVVLALWTSRLVLSHGTLTATNFFVSRSMPLVDVVDVRWSTFQIFGGKICGVHDNDIRTLVSGRAWDELWTTRAERIGQEIVNLAEVARYQAGIEL